MANSLAVGFPVRCRVWATTTAFGGQAAVNTLHYITAAIGAIPATDQDVADTLDGLIAADFRSVMAAPADYRGVQAQILKPVFPYAAQFNEVFQNGSAGAGTGGPDLAPGQVSGLFEYQTNFAGPQFRGRSYIPFPPTEGMNSDGTPAAPYLANMGSLIATFGSGLLISVAGRTATLVRVLLNRRNKAGVVPTPSPILSFSVAAAFATQKRRGAFGRQNRSPI